jgi:hypothetical protein
MEFLILGLLGMAFLNKKGGKQENLKSNPNLRVKNQREIDRYMTYLDKGDCWNCVYRDLNDLSDRKTKAVFEALLEFVDRFNKKYNKNMKPFETRRALKRQIRLIGKGKSQVNIKYAPHVQGRAIDFAEFKNNVWLWNEKDLKNLNDYLHDNFPGWKLLRTGRDFKHFVDWPHYEIKRDIWESWNV